MSEKEISFEEAIRQLEEVVDKLDSDEVNLESAIELYQKGMVLSELCHSKLKTAEKEITTLYETGDGISEKKIDFKEE